MNYPISTPTITQYFGANPQDYTRYGYPGHNGLDLWTADKPAYIYSVEQGIVEKVGYEQGGYGKYIVIKHLQFRSYYAHLSAVYVAPGAVCAAFQTIGIMGSTGNSTGPHLHLGIRVEPHTGVYKGFIDPLPVLTFSTIPPVCEGRDADVIASPDPVIASLSPSFGDETKQSTAKQPKKPYTIGSVIIGRHGRIMFRMKKYF